jgi:hypothetical protein
VSAFAVHPGMVHTELSRYMTRESIKELLDRVRAAPSNDSGKVNYKSIPQGAATTVYAATSTEPAPGSYLADCAVATAAPHASDPVAAERLWTLSEALVGHPL